MEQSVRHESGLVWWPGKEIGYYPVKLNGQYGWEYWNEYVRRSATSIGAALTECRIRLVERHIADAPLVDMGIGSGLFVEARSGRTSGFDVNPYGIMWLGERKLWEDPFRREVENASCWDSLEHMPDPERFVERVRKFLFMSLPIFRDMEHVLQSKHFKKGEHFWYFTERGLLVWMERRGLVCLEHNRIEEKFGREDIGTFVFRRTGDGR